MHTTVHHQVRAAKEATLELDERGEEDEETEVNGTDATDDESGEEGQVADGIAAVDEEETPTDATV